MDKIGQPFKDVLTAIDNMTGQDGTVLAAIIKLYDSVESDAQFIEGFMLLQQNLMAYHGVCASVINELNAGISSSDIILDSYQALCEFQKLG